MGLTALAYGVVAIDLGVKHSKNQFKVVANQFEDKLFGTERVPSSYQEGSHKISASLKERNSFYMQYASYKGPIQSEDEGVNVFKINEIWRLTLENYNASLEVKQVIPLEDEEEDDEDQNDDVLKGEKKEEKKEDDDDDD